MKYLTIVMSTCGLVLAIGYFVLRPTQPTKPCIGPRMEELKSGQLRADHAYQFCWDGKDWRLQEIKPAYERTPRRGVDNLNATLSQRFH